jgi:hypothetical protein
MGDDEDPDNQRNAAVLALLEAAAPDAAAAAAAWLVYVGAQWHPGCVTAQRRALLRDAAGTAGAGASAESEGDVRLVYVSNDVDDAGLERAQVRVC